VTRYAAFAGVAIAMAALAAEAQPSVGLPDARLRLLGSTPTTAYFLDLDSVAGQGVVDARVYAVGQRYEQVLTWRVDCTRRLQNVEGGLTFRGDRPLLALPATSPATIAARTPAATLAEVVCDGVMPARPTDVVGWQAARSRVRLRTVHAEAPIEIPREPVINFPPDLDPPVG